MSSISFSSSFAKPDVSAIRKQIDKTIDKDVTSGKISSDDAKAIKSAEDNISKLFDASSSATGAGSSFDPSQFKSKIDTLIDGQVKSGKLTSAQADELKWCCRKVQSRPQAQGRVAPSRQMLSMRCSMMTKTTAQQRQRSIQTPSCKTSSSNCRRARRRIAPRRHGSLIISPDDARGIA